MERTDERPRPAHLTAHNAAAFQLDSVVGSYHLRTPYPASLAPFLLTLATLADGRVLELGCGTGEITRMLAPHVTCIDAVDISAPMLERARAMPGGDDPSIHWILGEAETVKLEGPYALAVAGDSLHWMKWETVLPRVRRLLAPHAPLAIVTAVAGAQPWSADITDIFVRYSVMQDFQPYDVVAELQRRDLFATAGEHTLPAEPFTRTVEQYVAALHATSGFPRERMGKERTMAFDTEVAALVAPFATDGLLKLTASARVVWGRPGAN